MIIHDIISEVDDGRHRHRDPWGVQSIAVHRIWFDDWREDHVATPVDILRRFIDDPAVARYTGGEIPYTMVVDQAGDWWQALPLSDVGRHARRWSVPAVGVAVIGDMRRRPPAQGQYDSLSRGLADLCLAIGSHPLAEVRQLGAVVPVLAGHTELPGGTGDPTKECPGRHLPMGRLRQHVAGILQTGARDRLLSSGLIP